jgi:hypothetical protein
MTRRIGSMAAIEGRAMNAIVRPDLGAEMIERFRELRRAEPNGDLYVHLRQATDEVIAGLKTDAARWRALINSERIRIIGSARLGEANGQLSVEMWGAYKSSIPIDPDVLRLARQALTDYADGLR